MAASTVFLYLKICSMAFFVLILTYCSVFEPVRGKRTRRELLLTAAGDIIKSTYGLIDKVEYIKQNHLNTPAFEVGYVMFTLMEKYRKMVDKYNNTITMNRLLYMMELLMYLEEIETHHWEIEHLANMLHEIERKYGVNTDLKTQYREMTSKERNEVIALERYRHREERRRSTKRYKIKQKVLDRLTPTEPPKRLSPFPIDYGWEINYVWRKK